MEISFNEKRFSQSELLKIVRLLIGVDSIIDLRLLWELFYYTFAFEHNL